MALSVGGLVILRRAPLRRKKPGGNMRTPARDPTHDLWSRVVRTRDGFVCQRCGRAKAHGWRVDGAHILGRGSHSNLRYLVLDGVTLCVVCHDWFDTHKKADRTGEADLWVQDWMCKESWCKLLILAQTTRRPDDEIAKIQLRESLRLIKEWPAE